MVGFEECDEKFQWEGPKRVSYNRKHRCVIFYNAFSLDGVYYEVGDLVLVRNDDSIDPEDASNCYVGKIKELFEIDNLLEPHRAKIQWFSRLSELPVFAQKRIDRFHEWEVFEDNRPNWADDIDADTIFNKCVVKFLPVDANCELFEECSEEDGIPTFFCRYKFSGSKLIPVLKSDHDSSSLQNSHTPYENDSKHTTPKRTRTTSKKESYFATFTGTPEFPKVLIKKIDDRLLESPNVRIIVADRNAKTVDDVADTLKRTLFLDNQEENCEKRPIIHSLIASQKKSSDETLMMASPSKDMPKKHDSGVDLAKRVLRNTPQRISSLKDSESNMKTRNSPRLRKHRSCSPALAENFVNTPTQNKSTARRKSVKLDGNKALSVDADSDILENISTPSKQVRTPRKSRRLPDDQEITVSTDDETIVRTFSSKASGMNRRSKRFTIEEKLANGAGTKNSISTPSPNKRSKMGGRSVQFSDDQETAVTRSGRKVKRVDYLSQLHTDEKYDKNVLANSSKHLKKFIRANYSEDSDSGSAFSANESPSSDDEESVSDCAVEEKRLLSSKKKSTNTPKTKPRHRRDLLFIMPKRETPLKEPQNVLEESRLRLHAAAVPKSLPCREEEYSDIYNFVKDNLCLGTGGCMYISGVPGTGKTATVHEVMRNLDKEKNNGEIPCFTFVEVNGMWMTDPYKCYVHIFKSLTGKTIASQQACNLLEKRFTGEGPKKDAVVLLVDELDRLWTRKQTVMYNIFDWPSRKNSKLIVLAIANTMDLPERLMMNRVTSRLGLSRITFQPYNFKQLQEIIMNRIQELKVFDPDAVQFVARKVAAVSGDARRALAICRHAAEIVERSVGSPRKKHKILIGMEHVDEAIQQMFSSPVIAFIKSSSKVAKLFLEGMLDEFTRTGSEETTLLKVSTHVVTVCKFEGLKPPSSSELSSVCAKLAASHVILADNFQNDIHMKLRLGVDPDDINYALTGKGLSH